MPRDATKVRFGVGKLYSAVVGAVEPATLATAWAVAWTELGYTEDGSSFVMAPSYEDISVAEELDPLDVVATGRTLTVNFSLAQTTAVNLQLVLNGGTVTTVAAEKDYEPALSDAVPIYTALGWRADNALEQFVWRKCLQTGDVEIGRRRTSKAMLPTSFRVMTPSAAVRSFKYKAVEA